MNDNLLVHSFSSLEEKLKEIEKNTKKIKDDIEIIKINNERLNTIVIGKETKGHEQRLNWLEENHIFSLNMRKYRIIERTIVATIIGTIVTGFGVIARLLKLI